MILVWADRHRRRHGKWPGNKLGRVAGTRSETWTGINQALVKGHRGLPGGSSLALELQRHRNVINGKDRLTENQIFRWAQSHFRRTGKWPQAADGLVPESERTTWDSLNKALILGARGLPGGSCLKKLLVAKGVLGPGRRAWRPKLTPAQVWKWARAHLKEHGEWPRATSGLIKGTKGDTWAKVNTALIVGGRGLKGGSSLRKFLLSKGAVLKLGNSRRKGDRRNLSAGRRISET